MARSANPVPYADPPPTLSRSERNAMLEEAYEAYAQLFTAIRIARGGSDPHATALGGVSGKTSGTMMMCTTTTISGTLDDVAELYTARDCHYVLDFAESKRLYELESPTKENPLRCVGLRYSRWASTFNLVSDRDLLYLEVMDEFVDKKTGYRGWARCTKSIVHHVCPPVQYANGPLRAQLFVMGMVVRETAKLGTLELITLVHADLKKNVPSWMTRSVLSARKKNAQALSHVLKVKRRVREGGSGAANGSTNGSNAGDLMGAGPYQNSTTSADDTDQQQQQQPKPPSDANTTSGRRTCKGCNDKVSRWTRSYKCRQCHEMICKSCATMTYVNTDTQQLRNRVCADCSFATNEDYDCNSSVDGGSSVDELDVLDSQRSINELWRAQEHYKSERTREKEKQRHQRQIQIQHKTSPGNGDHDDHESRNRAYSKFSVEEKPHAKMAFPKVELYAPSDMGGQDDLGSTMRRLQLLNTAPSPATTEKETMSSRERHHSRRQREISSRDDGERELRDRSRERTDHSRERKDPKDQVSRAGPPVLQRTPSGGTSNHRTAAYIRGRKGPASPDTRPVRNADCKASVSPEKVHAPRGPHEARTSPTPKSPEPTSTRSRTRSPGPPKVPSSPVVLLTRPEAEAVLSSPPPPVAKTQPVAATQPVPAAPPVTLLAAEPAAAAAAAAASLAIDLSYLQSFANVSKP